MTNTDSLHLLRDHHDHHDHHDPRDPRDLRDSNGLKEAIQRALLGFGRQHPFATDINANWQTSSAVMFMIGPCPTQTDHAPEPCLILNKRSPNVRQPGDLCFPGGGISPRVDRITAWALRYLWAPFKQRALLPYWKSASKAQTKALTLHSAVALREAWEEIRLNPLWVQLLGYLPIQRLQVINRSIWPVVGWTDSQCRFKLNWEVQRIVYIPLKNYLVPDQYARFQPRIKILGHNKAQPLHNDEFPCFVHRDADGLELLWGATFRMVADFLHIVFGFEVPEMCHLPRIEGLLAPNYLEETPLAQYWRRKR